MRSADSNNKPTVGVASTNKYECQILNESHIDQCSKVMAKAFCDSPAYKYMFQEMTSEQRSDFLRWLFNANIRLTMSKCPTVLRGVVIPSNDDSEDNDNEGKEDQVICCFLWTPSPYHDLSTWEMIKAGLWQLPYRCGSWTALKRLFKVLDAHDNEKHFDVHEDFVLLERMSVLPEYQGQKIGSTALKETLAQHFSIGDNDDEPRPVRLSTQEERNVTFYKRLNFEVVLQNEKFKDEDPKFGYDNWFMVLKK